MWGNTHWPLAHQRSAWPVAPIDRIARNSLLETAQSTLPQKNSKLDAFRRSYFQKALPCNRSRTVSGTLPVEQSGWGNGRGAISAINSSVRAPCVQLCTRDSWTSSLRWAGWLEAQSATESFTFLGSLFGVSHQASAHVLRTRWRDHGPKSVLWHRQ